MRKYNRLTSLVLALVFALIGVFILTKAAVSIKTMTDNRVNQTTQILEQLDK
jgi:hypothetical protein